MGRIAKGNGTPGELVDQAGLADPARSVDEDDAGPIQVVEKAFEPAKLALAADEGLGLAPQEPAAER
ncbi:MAG: hypothetical protein M3331_00020 [Actinomycetota bacterium]|nr:hypothetical protein [Actinomycetota bacterium]